MRAAILVLLAGIPLAGVAEEKPAAPAQRTFDLKDPELQKRLRATITSQTRGFRLQPVSQPALEIPPTRIAASLDRVRQAPLRRPAVTECREFDCIAYDEKGNVLYTTPTPAPSFRIPDLTRDGQLHCLSTNEMLPTWQRVEVCNR